MRAVYVDAFGEGMRTRDEVDALLRFAQDAGLDSLVVQVTRRGDAFAGRLPLPRASHDIPDPTFDPLDAVCSYAGRAGIAVHAWIAVTPIGVVRDGRRVSDAVAPEFAPLITRRRDGSEREPNGIINLDPGHPETAEHTAAVATAIAREYPVSGVSLDRIRYPNSLRSEDGAELLWGYNEEALRRFEADGGSRSDALEGTEPWRQWRRRQTTALLARVAAALREERPEVLLSVNTVCAEGLESGWTGSRAYHSVGQDWVSWITEGRVDRAICMNYRGDSDDADLVDTGDQSAPGTRRYRARLEREGEVARVARPEPLMARFEAWNELAAGAYAQRIHGICNELPGSTPAIPRDGRPVVAPGFYLNSVARTEQQLDRLPPALAGSFCGFSYRNPTIGVLSGAQSATEGRSELARMLSRTRASLGDEKLPGC